MLAIIILKRVTESLIRFLWSFLYNLYYSFLFNHEDLANKVFVLFISFRDKKKHSVFWLNNIQKSSYLKLIFTIKINSAKMSLNAFLLHKYVKYHYVSQLLYYTIKLPTFRYLRIHASTNSVFIDFLSYCSKSSFNILLIQNRWFF